MKALLLNDFYTMKEQYTSYIKIMIPMMLLMGFGFGRGEEITELSSFSFMFAPFVVFAMSMITTLFTFEEKSGFMQYALTTPVTRKKYIQEKYLFQFLNSLAGVVMGGIAAVISALMHGCTITGQDILWLVCYGMGSLLISVMFCTWVIAMAMKFGISKGRTIMIALMLFVSLTVGFIVAVSAGQALNPVLMWVGIGVMALVLIATLIMFILSFRWAERKEL